MEKLSQMWWGGGLLTAAHDGDVAKLMAVLERCEAGEERVVQCPGMAVTIEGETPARRKRRLREAAVNYKNDDGFQALHMAVSEGHVSMMEALQREGADVNAKTGYGRSCLHLALEHCKPEAVECLLDLGCDPDLCNGNGKTAVQIAEMEVVTNEDTKMQLQAALDDAHERFAAQVKALHKELEQFLVSCDEAERQLYLRVLGQASEESPRDGMSMSMTLSRGLDPPGANAGAAADADGKDGEQGEQTFAGDAQSDSSEEDGVTSKSRTMRQVLIELEDLEADHTSLVTPLQKRLDDLEKRTMRLQTVIELINSSQRRQSFDFDGNASDGSSDKESEGHNEHTRGLMQVFREHAGIHETVTFEQMLEVYEDALVERFGDTAAEAESPETSLRKLLRQMQGGRRQAIDEIEADLFVAVMLRFENM
eukprot:TRINITY_DN2464_c1_g1_i1.p1 TRINITY_DN2464_c1_g1~~TRINITY_DN2464_c1_g1_i1.p1  ORF type:complete len:424 (+),score=193.33 TRINITY_DN2464_c1_g1_i1:75-1346(+)